METVRMKVEDMDCESCVKVITKRLANMSGVKDISVNREQKEVVVKYDNPAFCVDDFTCAIEDLGYNKIQVTP